MPSLYILAAYLKCSAHTENDAQFYNIRLFVPPFPQRQFVFINCVHHRKQQAATDQRTFAWARAVSRLEIHIKQTSLGVIRPHGAPKKNTATL